MLSEQALQGYAYQEGLTGEKAEDMQTRFLEEHGITFYHDMLRAKKELIAKELEGFDIEDIKTAMAPLVAAKQVLTEKVEEKI